MLTELNDKKYGKVSYEHLERHYKYFSYVVDYEKALTEYCKGNAIICDIFPFIYIYNPNCKYNEQNMGCELCDTYVNHHISPKEILQGVWRIIDEENFKNWHNR